MGPAGAGSMYDRDFLLKTNRYAGIQSGQAGMTGQGYVLTVGVGWIDEQHRRLIDLLADLEKGAGLTASDWRERLQKLAIALRRHIIDEEAFLTELAYAELVAHRRDHVTLLEDLVRLGQADLLAADISCRIDAVHGFKDALLRHLIRHDLDYKWILADGGGLTVAVRPR